MFRVLSDIHLDSGSVRIIPITRNTTKQDLFGIYVGFGSVRIHFYRIVFGLDFRVRFICPALHKVVRTQNDLVITDEQSIKLKFNPTLTQDPKVNPMLTLTIGPRFC